MKEKPFYNSGFKEQFLDTLESTSLAPVYSSMFRKSKEVEERLEKDIFNFNTDDIDLLFYTFSSPSVQTLYVYHSLIIRYVEYAISEGQRLSNINLYKTMDYTKLNQYVAYYKHSYVTLEEFNKFVDYLANDYDVAIFRALFEGIGGTGYEELRNLKVDDIHEQDGEFYVTLYDLDPRTKETTVREKKISYELVKDLNRANNQQEYISGNGEGTSYNSVTEFVESPYVFKPLRKGNYTQSDGQIDKQNVYRKSRLLAKITDGKISNVKTLSISGMIHEANELYKEKGELTGQDLVEIAGQYKKGSKSQNMTQQVVRAKEMMATGLEERYNIKL